MVREERLELSHPRILEPKSSASTNSATPANDVHYREGILKRKLFLCLILKKMTVCSRNRRSVVFRVTRAEIGGRYEG